MRFRSSSRKCTSRMRNILTMHAPDSTPEYPRKSTHFSPALLHVRTKTQASKRRNKHMIRTNVWQNLSLGPQTNHQRFDITHSGASSTLANKGMAIAALGSRVLRYGLVLVVGWIGLMKFTGYEANGIQPLVAHSPLMGWMYHFLNGRQFSAGVGGG